MAQYQIEHACGHEVTHKLFGPNRERERQIARQERLDCPACDEAARDAARAAENAAAAVANAENGFVSLEGSPKQIAWTETIRAKGLETLAGILARLQQVPIRNDEEVPRYLAVVKEVERRMTWLKTHPQARDIIDARAWLEPSRDFSFPSWVQQTAQASVETDQVLSRDELVTLLSDPNPAVRQYAIRRVGSSASKR
jgi:hypothetical protein